MIAIGASAAGCSGLRAADPKRAERGRPGRPLGLLPAAGRQPTRRLIRIVHRLRGGSRGRAVDHAARTGRQTGWATLVGALHGGTTGSGAEVTARRSVPLMRPAQVSLRIRTEARLRHLRAARLTHVVLSTLPTRRAMAGHRAHLPGAGGRALRPVTTGRPCCPVAGGPALRPVTSRRARRPRTGR